MDFAGLVKSLQSLNQATWQDTFLGLWIAALRLVQRVIVCETCGLCEVVLESQLCYSMQANT